MTDAPDKVDLETPDLAAEARAALAALFPGVVADGVLDASKLGELLDTPVAPVLDGRERYGLQWAGKHEAIRSLLAPGRATLAPDIEDSPGFDNATNVLVEGDSLEVLKLLQKAYNDRVKLIYIDPPYNTGNDFIYNDDFTDGLRGYLEYTGQLDEEGNRTSAQVDTSGRRHSRWLSMMYPRLILARNLLRQDGAICISIDANEDFNLRAVLDEVFGPENFVGQLVVIRAEGGGMAEQVIQGHDLLLIYARNRPKFSPLRRKKDFRGQIVQHEGEEYWIEEDWLRKEFGKYGICHYEEILEFKGQATFDDVQAKLQSGEYRLIKKKSGLHVVGRLRPTATDGSKFYSVVKHLSKEGKQRLDELGLGQAFDFPKPVSLIKSLVLGATFAERDQEHIFLDFFAGSGTTADAVMQQNAEDGGNRRFILISLPEPIEPGSAAGQAGFSTIAEVTRARILAAMEDTGSEGLRIYGLAESNFVNEVEPGNGELFNLNSETLRAGVKDVKGIAAEIFLREGVTLDAPWTEHEFGDVLVEVSDGVAAAIGPSLDQNIVTKILDLGPRVVVFLEDDLAGKDALKANAFTNARNRGITMKTT